MDTLGCINGGGEDEGGAEDGELHSSVHPPHPFQAHFVGQSRKLLLQKFLQQTAPVAARKRGSMLSGIRSARLGPGRPPISRNSFKLMTDLVSTLTGELLREVTVWPVTAGYPDLLSRPSRHK